MVPDIGLEHSPYGITQLLEVNSGRSTLIMARLANPPVGRASVVVINVEWEDPIATYSFDSVESARSAVLSCGPNSSGWREQLRCGKGYLSDQQDSMRPQWPLVKSSDLNYESPARPQAEPDSVPPQRPLAESRQESPARHTAYPRCFSNVLTS
jgi:hypothetical protein